MAGPTGRCTGCGKTCALDGDGMIRRHRRRGSTETGPIRESRDLCLGSWELPADGSVAGVDPYGLASSA